VQFEISPEDTAERTFTGSTPSECHKQLLEAINESRYIFICQSMAAVVMRVINAEGQNKHSEQL